MQSFFSAKLLLVAAVCLIVALALYNLFLPSGKGMDRFFADQHFHYETIRVVAHAPYGGADIGEVLAITRNIREKNTEDWYDQWYAMAERLRIEAEDTEDETGRGRALMRAQNYYRNAEFYLHPDDPRRNDTFSKSAGSFRAALTALQVSFSEFEIPYDGYGLEAIYYTPSVDDYRTRPLIVAHGGYDSTLEELYFWFVAPALERGYAVLTFSGPGQGAVIRQNGLPFTPAWERPTTAAIDEFTRRFTAPETIVLAGLSMGGLLAPRAAAFEPRIDGVIALDAMYNFQDTLFYGLPEVARTPLRWLHDNGYTSVVNTLVGMKMRSDVGSRWGIQNGQWVMGVDNPSDVFHAFAAYDLEGVANQITADVLLLWGDDDHFMDAQQLRNMQQELNSARSVTTRSYSREEGGHEHCQTGILTKVHTHMFAWIAEKFPSRRQV